MKVNLRNFIIIIPTYNERKNVKLILKKIKKKIKFRHNILFVDDNSNDGTIEVLKSIKSKHISHIIRKKKMGIGSAHKFGIKKSYKLQYKFIITMDCDGTHNPKYINQMIKKLDVCDLVITNRFIKKNSLREWNFFRKLITSIRHMFVCAIFNTNLDSSGAFRIYNCQKIKLIDILKIKSDGYSFFTESTLALDKKYKIGQIPILLPKRYSGFSKMRLIDLVAGFLNIFFLFFKKN